MKLLVVTQELHICTTTLETFLKLDLVLNDQSLTLVIDCRGKFCGNGMMSSRVLDNKPFVARNTWKDLGLLDRPFSNILPVLISLGVFLFSM